jgi:o-succinylbenzoate---CoA ligase
VQFLVVPSVVSVPAGSARHLVALSLPPGTQFVEAAERVWAADGAILPLDPAAPADVVRRLLAALRPHMVVDDDGEHVLTGAADVDEGVALVVATSGSTGVPKGAQLSWHALDASAAASRERIGADPTDSWLSCLPWQHIGGLQVWLRARMGSLPLDVQPRFDVDSVAQSPATLVSLVPTQLVRLLDAGVDLRRFRVILLGGAPAPAALLDRAYAAGGRVVTTYGMSETCGGCVYDGVPLDGVTVREGGDGRLRICGPVLMSRYHGRPDLTAAVFDAGADGVREFVTSDLGHVGGDGRVVIRGRADDVIITGGHKVVPGEVSAVLSTCPGVREVVVVGRPDREWGERVTAVVVPADPADPPGLELLRTHVSARLPRYACPSEVVLTEAIPVLPSGKPDVASLKMARTLRQREQSRTRSVIY